MYRFVYKRAARAIDPYDSVAGLPDLSLNGVELLLYFQLKINCNLLSSNPDYCTDCIFNGVEHSCLAVLGTNHDQESFA